MRLPGIFTARTSHGVPESKDSASSETGPDSFEPTVESSSAAPLRRKPSVVSSKVCRKTARRAGNNADRSTGRGARILDRARRARMMRSTRPA